MVAAPVAGNRPEPLPTGGGPCTTGTVSMAKTTSRRRKRKSQGPSDFIRETIADAVKSGLRAPKRRKLTVLQKAQRKIFRSSVAFLKRKGIIGKKVDARKVRSTSALRKTVRKNKALLERKEVAYTLPKDFPKQALEDLKKAGYKVRKGKLILPQGQYFRKPGKKRKERLPKGTVAGVYQKGVGQRRGGEIISIPLGPQFEDQIRAAFKGLKKNEWIGFAIAGHNSYNIYQSAEGMIADLNRYKFMSEFAATRQTFITHITIFRTKKPLEYLRQRQAERAEAERRYAENRRLKRQARRKVAEGGLRVSRGH